jgi:hypothetical protein
VTLTPQSLKHNQGASKVKPVERNPWAEHEQIKKGLLK